MILLGVTFAGRIQVTFTVIKIAALAGLMAVGLRLGSDVVRTKRETRRR